MVLSYIRMPRPVEEAMSRYGRWIGAPELEPPRLVPERDSVDLALKDEEWLGLAVFIFQSGPWTVIEELSGGLSLRPAESWLELAAGGDLVYAECNDSIAYAQLIVVQQGRLVRHILDDEQDSGSNVDLGRLPEEAQEPLTDWVDVTRWIEEDEMKLERPEQGWLWIHQAV